MTASVGGQGKVLKVEDLTVQFRTESGWLTAVENVSFSVAAGESLGIVGESGSGKSVTALSILRLHDRRNTRHASGAIRWGDRDLLRLGTRELRRIRGGEIAMIFQDPMSSLNPVLTIGEQILETLRLHQGVDSAEGRKRAIDLLELVRIPDAARRLDEYPHKLSGGMRQRVMIAMAVACRPKLLIADEPTTALDVTIQAQIIEMLRDLQDAMGMSVILITHDLGLIAQFAERVIVMYAGGIVEQGAAETLFKAPMHPYTQGLLAAIPDVEHDLDRLNSIPGHVPDPQAYLEGCRFHPRCAEALDTCRTAAPSLLPVAPGHLSRCPVRAARRSDAQPSSGVTP